MTVNRFFKMGGSSGSPTAAAPAAAAAVRASLEPSDEIAASALENVYDAPDDGQVLVMQVDGPAIIYVQSRSKGAASTHATTAPLLPHDTAPDAASHSSTIEDPTEMWPRVLRSFIFSACLFVAFVSMALVLHTFNTSVTIQYGDFLFQWHGSSLDKGDRA